MMKTGSQAALVLACRACIVQALLVLASSPVFAERADRNKPIQIEANSAVYDDAKKIMVIEGRVSVTKGTLSLRAGRVEQREDAAGNQFMTATASTGERVFFRQKRDGVDEFMEGEAERIEYDGKADVVRLSGKAVMRRLRGTAVADESTGNLIVFNNATETLSINGGVASANAPQGRVRMMLTPKVDAAGGTSTLPSGGVLNPALKNSESVKP